MGQRRGSLSLFLLAAAVAAALAGALYVLKPRPDQAVKPEPVVVAQAQFESTALFCIADAQGYFRRNGLAVTVRTYDTGAGTLEAVLRGEADVAVGPTEFPLVARAFRKEPVRAFARVAKTEFIYLVGRRDRGIAEIADLRGKRVGTTYGTIAEFYLGRFLELNGLAMREIRPVDLRTPAEWVDAIVDGRVDAVATSQPFVNTVRDRLGANAVAWRAQSHQPQHALVIATEEWLARHHDLVPGFLKALAEAETFAARDPAAAKEIVRRTHGLDPAYMETVWAQNQFSLSLDQSLILAMEDEARWMIDHGMTPERQMPDFLDYLHEEDLLQLMPGAVNIIRARRAP